MFHPRQMHMTVGFMLLLIQLTWPMALTLLFLGCGADAWGPAPLSGIWRLTNQRRIRLGTRVCKSFTFYL